MFPVKFVQELILHNSVQSGMCWNILGQNQGEILGDQLQFISEAGRGTALYAPRYWKTEMKFQVLTNHETHHILYTAITCTERSLVKNHHSQKDTGHTDIWTLAAISHLLGHQCEM